MTCFYWSEVYPDYAERMQAIALETVAMHCCMELGRHKWELVPMA